MMSIDATCPFCRNAELEVNRADHVPEYRGTVWLNCEHCQAMLPVCRTLDDAVKLVESITVSCDLKAVVVDYMEERMTNYHRQKEIKRFHGSDYPYVLKVQELEKRIADLERQLADMMHSRDCWKLECATADARAEQAEQRLAERDAIYSDAVADAAKRLLSGDLLWGGDYLEPMNGRLKCILKDHLLEEALAGSWHDGPEIPPGEWVVVEFEDDDGFRWFDLACSVEGTFFIDCNPKLLRWTRSTLAMPVPDVKDGT